MLHQIKKLLQNERNDHKPQKTVIWEKVFAYRTSGRGLIYKPLDFDNRNEFTKLGWDE